MRQKARAGDKRHWFGAVGSFDIVVYDNTILRGGSYGYAIDQPGMQCNGVGTNLLITNNILVDPMFYGLEISGTYNMVFSNNYITGPGLTGIYIASGASGTGTIDLNSVGDLASGQSAYVNDATSTFTASLSDNSWQGTPPAPPSSLMPQVESSSSIKVEKGQSLVD